MTKPKFFKTKTEGKIPLPLFFPDATKAVVRTLDSVDIANTYTPGVLVNTYHLLINPGKNVIREHKGIRNFMNWRKAVISDSGGFQVMSLAKRSGTNGKITDKGVTFKLSGKPKMSLTPEASIGFQFMLDTDLMVVLDDFTPPTASYEEAKKSVDRTILWARRSKNEYQRLLDYYKIPENRRPYLSGVVQGGKYQDLRKYCTEKLVKIGFDGLGYGGWPIREVHTEYNRSAQGKPHLHRNQSKLGHESKGKPILEFDYETAKTIKDNAPENYLLYGLGVGKPHEIVTLVKMGYHIFDCVLPTRDARHKRLYVFNTSSKSKIDLNSEDFYSYFVPDKEKYYHDANPVSNICDCLLCKNYTRSYLAHLFRENEVSAMRLSTIHNLRFYSMLMEKLRG